VTQIKNDNIGYAVREALEWHTADCL
jgi:hypothetical protein